MDDSPELSFTERVIWNIFIELHNRRQVGMEYSPILFGEMQSYLDIHEYYDWSIRKMIIKIICAVDNAWRKNLKDKSKDESKDKEEDTDG